MSGLNQTYRYLLTCKDCTFVEILIAIQVWVKGKAYGLKKVDIQLQAQ